MCVVIGGVILSISQPQLLAFHFWLRKRCFCCNVTFQTDLSLNFVADSLFFSQITETTDVGDDLVAQRLIDTNYFRHSFDNNSLSCLLKSQCQCFVMVGYDKIKPLLLGFLCVGYDYQCYLVLFSYKRNQTALNPVGFLLSQCQPGQLRVSCIGQQYIKALLNHYFEEQIVFYSM